VLRSGKAFGSSLEMDRRNIKNSLLLHFVHYEMRKTKLVAFSPQANYTD
jgi:hypothetical protein